MKRVLFFFFSFAILGMGYGQQNQATTGTNSNSRTPGESYSQIDVDATEFDRVVSGQNNNVSGLTASQLWSDDGSEYLIYGTTNSTWTPGSMLTTETPFVLGSRDLVLGLDYHATNFIYLDGTTTNIGVALQHRQPNLTY